MFVSFRAVRKRLARATLLVVGTAAVAALSACGLGGGPPDPVDVDPVPVKAALLLPYGGNPSDQIVATGLENAARLAVSDLSRSGGTIDLVVYNTAGDAQRAAAAALEAVADGAQVIIGPLYAEAANAAGLAVAESDVNVLAFSNNVDIAGNNVFVLGQTFDNTAERLIRYAAGRGNRRIAVMHAKDPAGQAGARAVLRAAPAVNAKVVEMIGYELSQQGIVDAMRPASEAIKESEADTVFLTAGVDADLPFVAQLLPENGIAVDAFQYVGLTHWDSRPALYKNKGMQGGWFTVPDRKSYEKFSQRYEASHDAVPHRLSGLAYDGVNAVGQLALSGRLPDVAGLTRAEGFPGVYGAFRLRRDGTNQRLLAVATIEGNQVNQIDPVPSRFLDVPGS